MTNKLLSLVLVILVMAVCTSVALASDAGPTDATADTADTADTEKPGDAGAAVAPDDEVGLFMAIITKARGGDWWGVFGAALLLAVLGARWLLGKWDRFKRWVNDSDVGGTVFTFAVSFLGMLGTAMFAGVSPGWIDVKAALLFAVVAAGGWSVLLKRFALPLWRGLKGLAG